MNESTEIEKLVAALETEPPETQISFYEDSDPGNRYGLVVGTEDDKLRNKLGFLFGCLDEELDFSEYTHFDVGDDWHGRGKVNMRDLADQFIELKGEFFSFSTTVAELTVLSRRQKVCH